MGKDDKKKQLDDLQNQEPTRIRFPKGNQFIGRVEKRLGGSRMMVRAIDGRELMARVPGRAKKFLWIREGNIVLLEPWEYDKERADLIYKYKPNEVKVLEREGHLKNLETIEEF